MKRPRQGYKTYLGDGVYASYDGFNIELTTEDGIRVTNWILLEPQVWKALVKYVETVKGEQVTA